MDVASQFLYPFTALIRLLSESNANTSTRGTALKLKVLAVNPVGLWADYFAFLSVPCGWISIDDLYKDRISLYSISYETQAAYLVEFDDGLEQYNTIKHPIMHYSQRKHARNLYIVPLDVFYLFTNKLDTTARKLVWMTHVGRCGSTVWSQIFNELPRWGVISEPHFFLHTLTHDFSHLNMETMSSSEEVSKMAVAGFKYQVGVFPPDWSVFMKTNMQDSLIMSCLDNSFPKMKVVHCYRNTLGVCKSWYDVGNEDVVNSEFNEVFARASLCPHSSKFLLRHSVLTYAYSWLDAFDLISPDRPEDQFEWCVVTWAASNRATKLAQSKGIDIKCIRYESLVSQKDNFVLRVSDYLGINQSLVLDALRAMKRDSQEHHPYNHEMRKTKRGWVGSKESIEKCDRMLLCLGYPSLRSEFFMPRTLQ